MSNRSYRVLFITYYYPPLGGAGVQRSLKFSKYLQEYGFSPIVIAADEPGYIEDLSLLVEVPADIEVCRFRHIPLLSRLLNFVRLLVLDRRTVTRSQADIARSAVNGNWGDKLIKVCQSLQFPDDKAGWGVKAYQQSVSLIERGGIDLIFSSSPPITAHRVAARLKQKFGIPWVADFRDLWTANPSYRAPSWRKMIDQWAERKLLATADGVVGVTKEIVSVLGRYVSSGVEAQFIPNGYDEVDFSGVLPKRKTDDRFVLLYVGTLYGHQTPSRILAATRSLLREYPDCVHKLILRFVGNIGSRFEPLFTDFDKEFPGVVERVDYLQHLDIFPELLAADALLLLIGGGTMAKGVLTGKVFEYLRACRPILLLGPVDGEAAALLKESGHGISFAEDDSDGVAELLLDWIRNGNVNRLKFNPQNLVKYERKVLTGRLANFFLSVLQEKSHA